MPLGPKIKHNTVAVITNPTMVLTMGGCFRSQRILTLPQVASVDACKWCKEASVGIVLRESTQLIGGLAPGNRRAYAAPGPSRRDRAMTRSARKTYRQRYCSFTFPLSAPMTGSAEVIE
jgi:hypothetical protein